MEAIDRLAMLLERCSTLLSWWYQGVTKPHVR